MGLVEWRREEREKAEQSSKESKPTKKAGNLPKNWKDMDPSDLFAWEAMNGKQAGPVVKGN